MKPPIMMKEPLCAHLRRLWNKRARAWTVATLESLALGAAPEIVQQPKNQMPYIGGSATFSLVTTGSPPLVFQWNFKDRALPGQTNRTLSVPRAGFANAGSYWVVASNENGKVVSETAWLSVLPTNVVNLGDRELSFSELSSPVWEGERIDDAGQTLSGDGLTLVFASPAPGGAGGLDIWMATRESLSSPWTTAANLGSTVNSAADENDPRLSRDGLSLYFDSNREGGQGDYDIWVATRTNTTGPFGVPVNLGPAINSSSSDGIPQISGDNCTLVFTSVRSTGPEQFEVWMSSRTNALTPWGPARHAASPINDAGNTFATEISSDGRLLFLKSWRALDVGINGAALYVSRRASSALSFEPPILIQPILALGARGADFCSLSNDGTTLYVGTYRAAYPNWPQLVSIQVNTLPQLSGPARSAPGRFDYELTGRQGATYDVEASTDLAAWETVATTNTINRTKLSDPGMPLQARRFYRVVSH